MLASIGRVAALLTASTVSVGFFSYLFQLVVASFLGVSEYGELAAALGLLALVSSWLPAYYLYISQCTTKMGDAIVGPFLGGLIGAQALFISIGFSTLGVVAYLVAIVLPDFLDGLIAPQFLLLGYLLLVSSAIFTLFNGILHGSKNFTATVYIGNSGAIVKVLLILLFGQFIDLTVAKILFLLFISYLLTIVMQQYVILVKYGKWFAHTKVSDLRASIKSSPTFRLFVGYFFTTVSFTIMAQSDVVLAQTVFERVDAGQYAFASMMGKVILYMTGGISVALFPYVSKFSHDNLAESQSILPRLLTLSLIISVVVALSVGLAGPSIVGFVYQDGKYDDAVDLLMPISLAFIPLSLVQVGEHYMLARGRMIYSWPMLFLSPLYVFGIYYYVQTPSEMIIAIVCYGLFTLIIGIYFSNFRRKDGLR